MNQLEALLANFETVLEKNRQKVWASKRKPVNLDIMAKEATMLAEVLIETGDYCFAQLKENRFKLKEQDQFCFGWINFEWADMAKAYLILWRDILFQQQKAQVLKAEGIISASAVKSLAGASQETLDKALLDFQDLQKKSFALSSAKKEKQTAKWQLQQNPWEVYRAQFQSVAAQCQRLQDDFKVVLGISSQYSEIKKLVEETNAFCQRELELTESIAVKTIEEIEQGVVPTLEKIAAHLEELETGFNLPNHFNSFTDSLDQLVGQLTDKKEVPVQTNYGLVELRDIFFKHSTKQWLDAEILPQLYEIWELTENTHNGLKMALINIKNRAILLSAEQKEGKTVDFDQEILCQPLKTFTNNLKNTHSSLEELSVIIHQRLSTTFNVSGIYDLNKEFLPVIMQSTIRQLRKGQDKVQNKLLLFLNKQWKRVHKIWESVEQEEALSDAEKIVRLIKERRGDASNSNYASIFLTKGFIGESFAVGRNKELDHARILIDNWKNGFRGSLLITGQRFSGKTLMGELIATQFFNNNTIRLSPDTLIRLNGRRMTTSFDLEPALDFIRKHAVDPLPLIWIDDLGLWYDKNLPLSQNVRTLRKYIDQYSQRLFFLVSMSNWSKNHLNLLQDINQVFQAEINVDKMPIHEVREAIMIRHGATHKTLVSKEGEPVNVNQFRALIDRVYRNSEGNIGEALNRWSATTRKVDEELVLNEMGKNFTLPDFVTADFGILLSSIMMNKRTNEYRLRKLFGPAFTDVYRPILQRLISIGLLNRQLDGWLEVNEVLVNDLAKLLESKGYL